MDAKKLKEEQYEFETQIFCPAADPTDFPPPKKKKKKKKKKKNIMQLETQKKGFKPKPQKLKSMGRQVHSNNSKKSKSSIAHKRTRYTDIYDDVEAKFIVMERADKILTHLENGLPHFVKCMLPSNVAHGFWLHLPIPFCNLHLPSHDTSIVLVDEWGNEYKTSYLMGRHGLSAGWRGFAVSHRLLKGDILIFHLTEPCKLKVHIVRVNGVDVVGAALCLVNMDACRRGTESSVMKKDKRKKTKFVEPFLPDIAKPCGNVNVKNEQNSMDERIASPSASNNDGFSSKGVRGSKIADLPQSNDLLRYSGASFLHDHPRELLTCT